MEDTFQSAEPYGNMDFRSVQRIGHVVPKQIWLENHLFKPARPYDEQPFFYVNHGQIALREWAVEILKAESIFNGDKYELSIAEHCPDVNNADDARKWLMQQPIPAYLQIHLNSNTIKVETHRNGVLVAYFVNAKSNAQWELTPEHAAEQEEIRQTHEAYLLQQRLSNGPSSLMKEAMLMHRPHDPEVDKAWEQRAALIRERERKRQEEVRADFNIEREQRRKEEARRRYNMWP